jgi:predicted P-loop ATPase/GTPase
MQGVIEEMSSLGTKDNLVFTERIHKELDADLQKIDEIMKSYERYCFTIIESYNNVEVYASPRISSDIFNCYLP